MLECKDLDGKEIESHPVQVDLAEALLDGGKAMEDKTSPDILPPDALILGPGGNVIELRPTTPQEAASFQPGPAKQGTPPVPLTEDEILGLFEQARERMKANGKTSAEILAKLDDFRKRQGAAEAKLSPILRVGRNCARMPVVTSEARNRLRL